jgi:hypothetical protein
MVFLDRVLIVRRNITKFGDVKIGSTFIDHAMGGAKFVKKTDTIARDVVTGHDEDWSEALEIDVDLIEQ